MKNCPELIPTKRQWTKTSNTFANNTPTAIKFSKADISGITQSGGSFCFWLCNLGEKALKMLLFL